MSDANNNPAISPVADSWIYQQLMSIDRAAQTETYNNIIENINKLTVSNVDGIELGRLKLYYKDIVRSYAVLLGHEKILPEDLNQKYEKEIIPLKTDKQQGFYMAETELAIDDLNLFYRKYDELRATNTSEFFLLANLANFGRTLRCLKKQCYMNGWTTPIIEYIPGNKRVLVQPGTIFQIKTNNFNHTPADSTTNYANPTISENVDKINNDTLDLIGLWTNLLNHFSYIDYVNFVMRYLTTYDKFIYPEINDNSNIIDNILLILYNSNKSLYNILVDKQIIISDPYDNTNNFKLLQHYIPEYANVFYFIFSHQAFDAVTYARFFGTRMMVTNIGFAWVENMTSNLINSVIHDYFFHNNLHELCYIYDNKLKSDTDLNRHDTLITQIDTSTYDVIRTTILELWNTRIKKCINYQNFMFILFYCLFEKSMQIVPDYNKKNPSHKIKLNEAFDTRYNLAVNIFDAMYYSTQIDANKPNYDDILDMDIFNQIKSENTKFKCPPEQTNGGSRKTQKHNRTKTKKHNRAKTQKRVARKRHK